MPAARTITVASGGGSGGAPAGGRGRIDEPYRHDHDDHPGVGGPLPPAKHVRAIMLSDQGYQDSFGHSTNDPYLGTTMVKEGRLISLLLRLGASPRPTKLP